MSGQTSCDVAVEFLSAEDSAATFERIVQNAMGIGTQEFLDRWDSGEWTDEDPDGVPGLVDVLMVLPLVR